MSPAIHPSEKSSILLLALTLPARRRPRKGSAVIRSPRTLSNRDLLFFSSVHIDILSRAPRRATIVRLLSIHAVTMEV